MKPTQLLASVLALSSVSTAWPWPSSLQNIKAIAQENGLYQRRTSEKTLPLALDRRQDNGGNNGGGGGGGGNNNAPPPSSGNAPAPSSGDSAPPSSGGSAGPTSGGDSAPPSSGGSDAPKPTGSDSAPPSSGGSDAPKSTPPPSTQYTESIGPNAQPGGINMILPNTQSTATQYYKEGLIITWQWNYTSLLRPPENIDVVATMSTSGSGANPSPYTLSSNYSFNPTETFTWDTGKYTDEVAALPTGIYTLMVYDAGQDAGVSATASPGHLGVYNQFRFGLYTTQSATPLATPYQCSTCNSANSQMQSMTLSTMLIVGCLTVMSFGWFADGLGLIRPLAQ